MSSKVCDELEACVEQTAVKSSTAARSQVANESLCCSRLAYESARNHQARRICDGRCPAFLHNLVDLGEATRGTKRHSARAAYKHSQPLSGSFGSRKPAHHISGVAARRRPRDPAAASVDTIAMTGVALLPAALLHAHLGVWASIDSYKRWS